MEQYKNKRVMLRGTDGKFRQANMRDFGIGGVCKKCNYFLLRHYDGDPRDQNPNPKNFRYRCFNCEPETDAEKKLAAEISANKPRTRGIISFLEEAANSVK